MANAIRWNGCTIKLIKVTQTINDYAYQRPIDPARRRAMLNGEFDIDAVDPIVVSARKGGKYAVLDGQQRSTWMKDQYNEGNLLCEYVPAKVHYGLTIAQESELFRKLNKRKPVNLKQIFKSALAEGEKRATAIASIVKKAGFTIGFETGKPPKGEHRINSIRGLTLIYDRWGVNVLRQTLEAIMWGTLSYGGYGYYYIPRDATKDQFLLGVAMAIAQSGERSKTTTIARYFVSMQEDEPSTIWDHAVTECRGNRYGDAYAVSICNYLIRHTKHFKKVA